MSAITAALSQIDRVAAEGDLAPEPTAPLELEAAGEPIVLPDGKRIYPPCLPGAPVGHERPAEPARLPAGGHLMTPANSTISARRPAVFVQQLHRAAAQRGRLDPVFQELSDHWTRVLQRLYPVWTLIGPGLSDPGHIEIHSRTVYLDSETLLGTRAAIAAGQLEQRAILRCFGVCAARDAPCQAQPRAEPRGLRHRLHPPG